MPHKRIDPVKPEGLLETTKKLIQANNILDNRVLFYWLGSWNVNRPYGVGSVVTDGTSTWIAIRPNTGVVPINGLDWVEIGTSASGVTREIINHTTGFVVSGTEVTGEIDIAKSFVLNKVTSDQPARIRFYCTDAFRTADASRPVGTDPTGEFGLLLELILTSSFLDFSLAPPAPGYNDDTPITSTIYYAIRNDGVDGSINLDIDTTILVL